MVGVTTDIPPLPEPHENAKGVLNLVLSALFVAMAAWMTAADFSYPGDMAFQTSSSVMLTAILVSVGFLALIAMAALPKRFIIPANFLLLSRCSLGFPLNMWMGNSLACRAVTLAFLALSVAYLFTSLWKTGWLRKRPWLRARHSLAAAAAWLLLGLLTLPVLAMGFGCGTRNLLGDYMTLTPTGVRSVERTFEKDGQTVHLVGMMHIGHGAFYSDLKTRLTTPPADDKKRLILTEGVSDRNGIIPKDFANGKTYERWAKLLGLEAQKASPESASTKAADADALVPGENGDPHITWRNADMDVSDLKEPHRKLLVGLLEKLSSADLAVLMDPHAMQVDGKQIEDLFMNGLLLTRNNALMGRFTELSPGYQEIFMPWGAAHLPDIEKRLLALGYRKTGETIRPVIEFWK